ncbi:MAG: NADAR family protein [Reyranellaceae bacterium]
MIPIPSDNRILYFARDRAAFGFLSHFHPSPIRLDGESWPTVEHYYQAQKSPDPAYRAAIREPIHPGRAKSLAAQPMAPRRISRHSWFKAHDRLPRQDWHDVKLDIMRRADRAKYEQNPDLCALLLDTGNAELIEDSPTEPFWGIGPDGTGPNWAGRVVMEVRESFRGA